MSMDILLASLEALSTKSETNPDPVIKSAAYTLVKNAFTTGDLVIQPKTYVFGVKMILDRLGIPYTEKNDHPLKFPSKTLITIDFTPKNEL